MIITTTTKTATRIYRRFTYLPPSFRLHAKLEGPRCMARSANAVLYTYIYIYTRLHWRFAPCTLFRALRTIETYVIECAFCRTRHRAWERLGLLLKPLGGLSELCWGFEGPFRGPLGRCRAREIPSNSLCWGCLGGLWGSSSGPLRPSGTFRLGPYGNRRL